MIFSKPTPWTEAIASRELRAAMPTAAGSAELSAIAPEVRERAMFSARTADAWYLDQVNKLIARIVSPETIRDPETGALRPVRPGETMDPATARLEMKTMLAKLNYQPDPELRGGIQDLSSDARLDLIVRTNTEMAQGFGNWFRAQDPDALDAWPAQELYRIEQKRQPRQWGQRWNNAISELGGETSAKPVADPMAQSGMFAVKNDGIWTAISAFGLPYPPFDFNSGMWVRDISRSEAISLGILSPGDPAPEPDQRGFNDDLSTDFSSFAPAIAQALQEILAIPLRNEFDPNQPRDEGGRWTDYGGGTSKIHSKAFESVTVPLRKRTLFGDQVAFMTADKVGVGVLSGPDEGEGFEITLEDGTKIRRKKEHLRMPVGGHRGRDT